MAALAEAGIEVVGENRAQDLEAKHAAHGDAFRWHFIGHLQSRKAKVVNGICELVHSLDSESAARRLEIPALVAGQPRRRGDRSRASRRRRSAPSSSSTADVRGLLDDAAGRRTTPKTRARTSANCVNWRKNTVCAELSMGTSQDYRVAAEEGATMIRMGSVLYQG